MSNKMYKPLDLHMPERDPLKIIERYGRIDAICGLPLSNKKNLSGEELASYENGYRLGLEILNNN